MVLKNRLGFTWWYSKNLWPAALKDTKALFWEQSRIWAEYIPSQHETMFVICLHLVAKVCITVLSEPQQVKNINAQFHYSGVNFK